MSNGLVLSTRIPVDASRRPIGSIWYPTTNEPYLPAGRNVNGNYLDQIVSTCEFVSYHVNITMTTTPYTAGDVVGGEQTLANAVRFANGSGVLWSVSLDDLEAQGPALALHFFHRNPDGTYTDNAAPNYGAGSANLRNRKITTWFVEEDDWKVVGSGVVSATPLVPQTPFVMTNSETDVILVPIIRSAETYAGTTEGLSLHIQVART